MASRRIPDSQGLEKKREKVLLNKKLSRNSEKEPQIRKLMEQQKLLTGSLHETEKRINEINSRRAKVERAKKSSEETIWLPKVICVFSPYLFYDKYREIIEKLVHDFQKDEDGLCNLFEALVFEIVCCIETPVRNPVKYRDILVQSSTTNYNLPYISDSFFNTLLKKVQTHTIITIFTHLLCEEKIILVA